MPTQGWRERKSLAAQGIWSRLSKSYSHQTKSPSLFIYYYYPLLFTIFDVSNSLNTSWITRTRRVPSKHFFMTITYPVSFWRKYLPSSLNFSGTRPQEHTRNLSLITWLGLSQAGCPILQDRTSQLIPKLLRNRVLISSKNQALLCQKKNKNKKIDGIGL